MAAITASDTTVHPWTPTISILGAFVLAAIVALHPTAFAMAKTWLSSSAYHHGAFVAPIALWMILAKSEFPSTAGKSLPGYVISAVAGILWLMGRAAGVSLIEEVAVVTLLIGAVGAIFGAQALRAWAYPLLFLYLMVPFGEVITPALQALTANVVVWLLSAIGMKTELDGYLIHTSAGAFEVAEACAGLRFLLAAIMIAAAYAYVSINSWRKRIGFLVFAIFIAFAANGLRAFLLVFVATITNKQLAVGPDHVLIGWVFYTVVFLILLSVGRRMADQEGKRAAPEYSGRPLDAVAIAAAPLFAILAAITLYAGTIIERPIDRVAPATLTLLNAPGWRILPPPANWRANFKRADRTAGATYANQDTSVYVWLSHYAYDRQGAEIVHYDNRAWDGEQWRRIGAIDEVVYLFGASETHPFDILAGPERRRLAVVTAYWLGDEIFLDPRDVKWAQMKSKLQGVNPPGGSIMIAASYNRDPMEAVHAIRAFTSDVETLSDWLARNAGS